MRNIKDYRLDIRTFKEFALNCKNHTEKEVQYAMDWLERHNGKFGRKKRDYVIILFGCKDTVIFESTKDAKRYYKPDFLLGKCEDNQYIVNKLYPIEITTCKTFSDKFYLKKSKVIWEYDKLTPQITDLKHYVLFIANTLEKGKEKYTLLKPEFLNKLKKRPLVYPICFGGKPCYEFYKNEVKWNYLYPEFVYNEKQFKFN